MASTNIQDGEVLGLTMPADVSSGDGVQVGSIFGVATSDYLTGETGQVAVCGVWSLAKTSAQAWTEGQKIYWDNGNLRADSDSTVGMLIGVATAVAANPSSTGYVRLNGSAPSTAEGPQAAVADLTDNSGGAAADGTIGAVTPSTALTDNGGGTADGTVAAQAAPVALTDNTGDSGTHDDTLADGVTVGAALTDNTAGTANTTLEALADGTTYANDVAAIRNNFADLAARANELRTDLLVHNQNTSDVAQKVNELVTLADVAQNNLKEVTTSLAADRTAVVALTDAVKELSTKLNTTLARLRAAGIIAT
jgi:predicted RecA/RadA family phage recombinase